MNVHVGILEAAQQNMVYVSNSNSRGQAVVCPLSFGEQYEKKWKIYYICVSLYAFLRM